jgi:hypothetical protein
MCDHSEFDYEEFPSRTLGGGSGSYELLCDVTSCHHAEFIIVSVTTGDAVGITKVFVSGNGPQPANAKLDYAGTTGAALNKDNAAKGMAFSLLASTCIFAPMQFWERITDSQKKVYVRIDTPASNSVYASIRFRIARLKVIPGPSTTVHPDNMQAMSQARADAVRQRLGLEEEIAAEESISTRRMRSNAGRK